MAIQVTARVMRVAVAALMAARVAADAGVSAATTATGNAKTTVTAAAAVTTPMASTTAPAVVTTATQPVALMTTAMLERFIRPMSPPKSSDSIVSIIYNGNRRLAVDPCNCIAHVTGGIDREATVIDVIRSTSAPAVLLDAGGFLREPALPPDVARADCLFEVLRALEVDAINVALPDLSHGLPLLEKLRETYGARFVSANILDEAGVTPLFEPYRIVPVKLMNGKQVRVGVIGITRQVADGVTTTPKARVTIADPVATLHRYIPEIRKKSDVVVLLTYHRREDAEKLLRALVPGARVDLAISSEMTIGMKRDYYLDNLRFVNGVPLASTWMEGRTTSHLMLDVRDQGTTVASNKLIEIEQFIAPRADITTMVTTCKARLAAQ